MTLPGQEKLGLQPVLDCLEQLGWPGARLEAPTLLLGAAPHAGSRLPLASSAALLHLDRHSIWLPAPDPQARAGGPAALFRFADRLHVLPIIRLCADRPGAERPAVTYLTLKSWLTRALQVWRFPLRPEKPAAGAAEQTEPRQPRSRKRRAKRPVAQEEGRSRPLLQRLHELKEQNALAPELALDVIARVVWYALFGADDRDRWSLADSLGLLLPLRSMWLRPVPQTPLGLEAASSLVLTARLPRGQSGAIPSTILGAEKYRIRPGAEWGVDPVHTPEGTTIRLSGHLGAGVSIRADGTLKYAPGEPPLSCSTGRIPFAGHDDPRRLLMAANMQVQAVALAQPELPRVRVAGEGLDPPGVNLRIAYLAWRGLNHEDAWVLSRSAADRLTTEEEVVQTLFVRAVELPPEVLVRPEEEVKKGALLIRRRVAPAFLIDDPGALAQVPNLAGEVTLGPEPEDRARFSGTVRTIETWDLLRTEVPKGYRLADRLTADYRMVLRITLQRRRPADVGDKLANRHGHKGIIGAVVDDEDMPRWHDEPLEALIDPISVLNRSNWGQVYEALAGAGGAEPALLTAADALTAAREAGCDERGRWPLEPPASRTWLTQPVEAVAGVQFVMRLPQHAADRLKRREQRFGEMDHWALWAHGPDLPAGAPTTELAPAAEQLARLLAGAGYDFRTEGTDLVIRPLPLGDPLPQRFAALDLTAPKKPSAGGAQKKGGQKSTAGLSRPEAYRALDQVEPAGPTALVFDPPVADVPLPCAAGTPADRRPAAQTIRWLAVVPSCDRPERTLPDGSKESHPLTDALRQVVRCYLYLKRGDTRKKPRSEPQLRSDLRWALADHLRLAYELAVGRRASGAGGSRGSLLRRSVLGYALPGSGRAVISPGGADCPLGLNEIGLPRPLALALFATDTGLEDRWLWLKRDPVLHRWGLVRVRPRVVDGSTIRLPASLLGPMGADFDGDTMAVFADLPGQPGPAGCCPTALAWDDLLGREMFVPGKQYLFGLLLLLRDPERRRQVNEELRQRQLPEFAAEQADDVKCLKAWVKSCAQTREADPDTQANGWRSLEQHALAALARNPALDFGLYSAGELAELEVIRCGAAKAALFDRKEPKAQQALQAVLAGRSLDVYRPAAAPADDPIAAVMVSAKLAVGKFGGALRRLLFAPLDLDSETIRQAMGLTEQVTQRVLSVKAGQKPMPFEEFNRQLRRLLAGEPADAPGSWGLSSDIKEVLTRLRGIWDHLHARIKKPPPWLRWLRAPHELARLLVEGEGALRLPVGDLRVSPFCRAPASPEAEAKREEKALAPAGAPPAPPEPQREQFLRTLIGLPRWRPGDDFFANMSGSLVCLEVVLNQRIGVERATAAALAVHFHFGGSPELTATLTEATLWPYEGVPLRRPGRALQARLAAYLAAHPEAARLPLADLPSFVVGALASLERYHNRDNRSFAPLQRVELAAQTLGGLTPEEYARITGEKVQRHLGGQLGSVCRLLEMRASGRAPTREEVAALPGVGPEKADTLLVYLFGRSALIVDEYLGRILYRHFLTESDKPRRPEVARLLGQVEETWENAHRLHARANEIGVDFCSKKDPKCEDCPLRDFERRT
jgi:hypothetical protein